MKTIYKYKLELRDSQEIAIPYYHKVRHVGLQNGDITLWAEIDTNDLISAIVNTETFHVVGTGQKVEPHWVYIGTCVGPVFVWHVYANR
jgi:hypothetical protein